MISRHPYLRILDACHLLLFAICFCQRNMNMKKLASAKNLFYMATLNNLGQVYRILGDDEKARYYFAHLRSALLLLQQQEGGIPEKHHGYIWRFFQTSTTFLSFPSNERIATNKLPSAAATLGEEGPTGVSST